MANKSSVVLMMTSSFTEEPFEPIDADVSDSDSWQVIDPSDSDEGSFSYGDVTTTDDDVSEDEQEEEEVERTYGSPCSDISMQSLIDEIKSSYENQEVQNAYEIDQSNHQVITDDDVVKENGLIDGEEDSYEEERDETDEEDEDDGLDLDDELVPKWLNNKFERQRMRKLGKRAYPKMKKSKRLVNQYNKPGCVHGKHGLGMKHNLVW